MGKVGNVLIARNAESFSFIYQETIDRWEDVSFFDPESDAPDLSDIVVIPSAISMH